MGSQGCLKNLAKSVELCYGWVKFWQRQRRSSGNFTFFFYDFFRKKIQYWHPILVPVEWNIRTTRSDS